MTTVQLFSGGLDSLAIWHLFGHPQPVYIRIGAPYEDAEISVLHKLGKHIPDLRPLVIDGPQIATHPADDGHILHRNLVLLTVAASYTGADVLYLGAVRGEASADKNGRFLRATSRALSVSERRRVTVLAPARHMTKVALLRRLLHDHPAARSLVDITRSCYEPDGVCGQCQACFRRDVALFRAGVSDHRPTLPTGVTATSARAGLRTAGVAGWPGVIANNAHAVLALAGLRREDHS